MVTITLSEQEAAVFNELRKNPAVIVAFIESGALTMRGGSVTINVSPEGAMSVDVKRTYRIK